MNLMNKEGIEALRENLRRPYGGVTTFLPTEVQADFIRLSLIKNFKGMEERNDSIWLNAGKQGWQIRNRETCVPVLVRTSDKKGWLFLTHHFLDSSSRELRRGESDVLVEYKGGMREYVGHDGIVINPGDWEFNHLNELIGGRWVNKNRGNKTK